MKTNCKRTCGAPRKLLEAARILSKKEANETHSGLEDTQGQLDPFFSIFIAGIKPIDFTPYNWNTKYNAVPCYLISRKETQHGANRFSVRFFFSTGRIDTFRFVPLSFLSPHVETRL